MPATPENSSHTSSSGLNNGWSYRDRIERAADGKFLLAYYEARYPHSDAASWQQRLRDGEIERNGLRINTDQALEMGDELIWHRPPWREPDVPLNFEIIDDNGDLIVINKPSGLPVMPAGGFLDHTLLALLEKRWPDTPPRPVHRLGRGTSGLLLAARKTETRAWLSAAFRDHGEVEKVYRCLTEPVQLEDEGHIDLPIGKQDHPKLGRLWCANADGLPSRSDFRVLRRNPESNLLEVRIHTGRPHQIRIHLAAIGAPLLGDPLYTCGGKAKDLEALPGDLGYHLHAHRVRINTPEGQPLAFEAPLPEVLL